MRRKRRICIVDYAPEEYTRFYIVQALFKLMSAYEYDKISVTDIAEKAGVGRATFYRYFKRKEDVIIFYFEHNTKEFVFGQHFYPRCREDYLMVAKNVFKLFKQNKEPFKLLRKARLEHIYLDFQQRLCGNVQRQSSRLRQIYAFSLCRHAVQRVYALAGRRLRRRY